MLRNRLTRKASADHRSDRQLLWAFLLACQSSPTGQHMGLVAGATKTNRTWMNSRITKPCFKEVGSLNCCFVKGRSTQVS